ncbi:MAG: biopolymer transporter ExbD [Cyanobacteria bacterium REEB65]|nr:biopolymer transporter ExbD [Cyanobacteria bacterium REEB65]
MIDVFMILALFLMVMAFLPQINESLKAELPSSKTADQSPPSVVVQLTSSGEIDYQGDTIGADVLQARIKTALAGRPDLAVIVAADKNLPYQRVVSLIDTLKTAGVTHLALATAPGAN